jgi:Reverse transcriptase (RNA-dependent DNA polymerase)
MDGKFVFRLKRDQHGNPVRWKARFVVKGYSAIYGIDYNETTSPTMRMETFRAVAHVAATNGWPLHQVDIKTAFLRGVLEPGEEVYMKQPKGFEAKGEEDLIWELQKGLYGLPQAGRIWNKAMNQGMLSIGFTRIKCEYCLYFRQTKDGIVLTGIHVDDFLLAASSLLQAANFKQQIASIWEISDLGEAKFCVGIAIERDLANHHIYLSQTALIDKILASFNMIDCNPVSTPMEAGLVLSRQSDTVLTRQEELDLLDIPYRRLVGLLMYLAIATRPDIALAVQKLSQFMNYYRPVHWNAAKRVVRYLKGTRNLQLRLGGTNPTKLVGFTDASYACCPDSGKSVGAYCFSLGAGMISWAARKQKTVAQSTCDAEYIACAEAARECMWLRMLTAEINLIQPHPTPLLTDNESALALAKDPRFHARAKHINTRCHYIRECIDNSDIYLSYVNTDDNIADILTKPLAAPNFLRLRSFLGLCDLP